MKYAFPPANHRPANLAQARWGRRRTINDWTRAIIAMGFLIAGAFATFWSAAAQPAIPIAVQERPTGAGRFDYLVREHFFAGFAGDQSALERGMKICEEALSANPKHAEAMVW